MNACYFVGARGTLICTYARFRGPGETGNDCSIEASKASSDTAFFDGVGGQATGGVALTNLEDRRLELAVSVFRDTEAVRYPKDICWVLARFLHQIRPVGGGAQEPASCISAFTSLNLNG